MTKYLALAAMVAALLTACLPSQKLEVMAENPKIAVVGDSLTAGIGAHNDTKWYEGVAGYLGASEVGVSATSGWTTRDALDAGPPMEGADLVLIFLGSNDQVVNTDPAQYQADLAEITAWGAQCFIIAPWERTGFSDLAAWGITPAHSLLTYRLHASSLAEAYGCGFWDAGNVSTEGGMTVDGLHQTPHGEQVIAMNVAANLS